MKKMVGFGDFLVRLNPPGYLRFLQAGQFEVNYTGAEANVCVSLAMMGMETSFVTRLPDNEIARCGLAALHKLGVGTTHVVMGGERMGLLYVEKGASQRPSRVVYDRGHTAFATASASDFDWDTLLSGAELFHFTGITPALGDALPDICLQACRHAKERGVLVSCDLNYRRNLWTPERAKEVMEGLMPYVDVLIANEEDAEKVFGIRAANTDVTKGQLDRDGYVQVAQQIERRYGVKTVAITLRRSISASDNDWGAMLYTGGTPYFSRTYAVHLVDRVGGGDSFSAGLLFGIGSGFDPQKTIEYAAAASCLKQTMEWDVNLASREEIELLAAGDGSGRVRR